MSYPEQDIHSIERHLSALDALDAFPPNRAMLERLKAGMIDPEDLSFHQHEMIETQLMAQGVDARTAHLQTLARQGIAYEPGYEVRLYHPSVILRYPDHFNPAVHNGRLR